MEEVYKKGVDGQEEEISKGDLELKKKQAEFERKKASGELELEEKMKEPPAWYKWLIIFLVLVGILALAYFLKLI